MHSYATSILDAHDEKNIEHAAKLIREGGLVAFVTETVYGLGTLGLDVTSVQRIFDAKERPSHNPLILHVATISDAKLLFNFPNDEVIKRFNLLTNHFWPGPLTIVCEKSSIVPDLTTAGSNKVAVRIPNHAIALKLLTLVGKPVAAPSANASGRPSATSAETVLKTLDGKIDAVLDAGSCLYGLESTVIDISANTPVILRTGAISVDVLGILLPTLTIKEIGAPCLEILGSPGLSTKHYSPQIQHIKLATHVEIIKNWNSSVAMLTRQETYEKNGIRFEGMTEILPNDPVNYAHELYAALYRLENSSSQTLLIEEVSQEESWLAIRDRLMRACA